MNGTRIGIYSAHRTLKYYERTSNMVVRQNSFATLGPFLEWQRGAGLAFVQSAVDRFGLRAIRYDPSILVTHLEFESTVAYFKKNYLYGRARQLANRTISVAALTVVERIRIFRKIVHSEKLSTVDAGLLLGLLVVG